VVSLREVNGDLYALKLDGSEVVNLTRNPGNDWHGGWSPDGRRIVFDSDRDSEAGKHILQVYMQDLGGGQAERLTDYANGACCPLWSPDGQKIAFSKIDSANHWIIYTMDANGENKKVLNPQSGKNVPLAWSADGKHLVVSRIMNENSQAFLMTLADGSSLQIQDDASFASWQPALVSQVETVLPLEETPVPAPPLLALINGALVDGSGAEPIPDAVLVIEDGRVSAAGRREDVVIPKTAVVIDVQGGTILPGFFNAHAHQAVTAQNLETWAQEGVTTVCDLAEEIGGVERNWNTWVEKTSPGDSPPYVFAYRNVVPSHLEYARMVASGPMVSVADGYPASYWGPNLDLSVASPDDARQKVSALLDAGADVIKIALESGPRLTVEEIQAIVETAHQRGIPVLAHVNNTQHLQEGVEGGIDAAVHMATDRWSDELMAEMIAREVILVPTLDVLSEACSQPGACLENLQRFVSQGGKVALGNDYGNTGVERGMPMREIELMLLGGMTPMQIIVAATQNAARVCNLENELGVLAPGMLADILVVRGNPLEDLHALEEVLLVIHEGVVIRELDPQK
jgi:enamidase